MRGIDVFVVVLTFLQSPARGDNVDCVFNESCILPCRFQAGEEVLIHWYHETSANEPAHSYYSDQDHLKHQNQLFHNITSLFTDKISGGNASLLLTGVKIQHQGRYRCYTSTSGRNEEESYINLNVNAPVRRVDIQQVGNRTTCSSDGVYPKPELTWTTKPPSNMTLQSKTTVQQTDEQLYNISSSLMDSGSDVDYSCTVSTRSNRRTTTLFKPTSISGSQTETTIPCTSSNPQPTGLIWRFNHSHIILVRTGASVPYNASKDWTQLVKRVSESGNLTLQELSPDQEGIYSCELSDAEETYITTTTLRIIKDSPNNVAAIAGGVIAGIVGAVLIGLAVFFINKKRIMRSKKEPAGQQPNVPNMNRPPPEEEIPLQDMVPPGGGQR